MKPEFNWYYQYYIIGMGKPGQLDLEKFNILYLGLWLTDRKIGLFNDLWATDHGIFI